MTQKIKVGLVQHAPVFLNLHQTINKAVQLIDEAGKQNIELLVFPETWLPGYPVWLDYAAEAGMWDHAGAKYLFKCLYDNAIELQSDELEKLKAAAKNNNMYLVLGANEKQGGTLYNTIIYLDKNGKDCLVHRKLTPTYTERLVWGQGDGSTLQVMATEFGNVGALVCWEHWMPLARAAMHAQHEVIHIAQWPAVKELHQIASRQYAFEGQTFVLASGCVMTLQNVLTGFDSLTHVDQIKAVAGRVMLESMADDKNELLLFGGSCVIQPNTDYLLEPQMHEEKIVVATLDLSQVAEGYLTMDADGHYSRPDVFTLHVDTSKKNNVTFFDKSKEQ